MEDDNSRATAILARAQHVLLAANLTMIAMVVIHDIDHVRQAARWCYTIGLQLWLVNISVYIPSLVALALLLRRWRGAAAMTCFNGLFVGAAFSEVHLWRPTIPVWGIWNRSFFILGADWISWTVLAATVFVGALVAVAGGYAAGLQWTARRLRSDGE